MAHEGVLEESPLEDMRRQLDVNLFGTVEMDQVGAAVHARAPGAAAPSTSPPWSGYVGLPGIASYTASKSAWKACRRSSRVKSRRSIYDAVFDSVRQARAEKSGQQNGDPDRATQVVLDLLTMENPPVHLILGSDAIGLAQPVLQARLDDI
jgi:hypothetical protein